MKKTLACAIGLIAVAATTGSAVAGATAKPARGAAGKTVTLRLYSAVQSFTYTRADGTVVAQPPQTPAAGDQFEIVELGYKGTFKKHAKKFSASAHTVCVFKTATSPPACTGQAAVSGAQMLLFRTPAGGDTVVVGGTGRYAGATGTVTMTEIPKTNDSDVVITVQLKQ